MCDSANHEMQKKRRMEPETTTPMAVHMQLTVPEPPLEKVLGGQQMPKSMLYQLAVFLEHIGLMQSKNFTKPRLLILLQA